MWVVKALPETPPRGWKWAGWESGGWGDGQAIGDPEVYGGLIARGVDIIQTDSVEILMGYLRSKSLQR